MKFYDISWPISEQMTAYKDKKTVTFESVKTFQLDAVRESKITIGAHSGTHIDAPSHFIKDGATIDAVDLTAVIGPCKVFDLSTVADCIRAEDIENLSIEAGDRVLFKTANSALAPTQSFASNFIYLSSEAAQMLVQLKVQAVGIDYLGIERAQQGHTTHRAFFNQGITIIEGLRFAGIAPGEYFLCCLPLYVVGLEAAPARAILMHMV